ncbi:hypothetical protein CABS02_09775 [Colletotrichum abscissum]|uniref:DUF7029 domain-containing protein n=1 Tax=Colletotrichum abscissum TaxID=1671311 RepID=A0A9P9XB97_9PEZI|nr:hypothetical protein CABS02_09775 [Colletotrichum abscissum]
MRAALLVAIAGAASAYPASSAPGSNGTFIKTAVPTPCPSPVEKANRFGFMGEQTATFAHDGPHVTLSPNIHWSCDTTPAANVIPIPPSKGFKMYYGVGDPAKAGAYAFVTYHFTAPSVNLDHCDHVAVVIYDSSDLVISFGSQDGYQNAVDTWNTDDGLILVAFAKGCGDYKKGDRCFFRVSSLKFHEGDFVITASGTPSHPDDIITVGETEWGRWTPRGHHPQPSSASEPTFTWGSAPAATSGSSPFDPGSASSVESVAPGTTGSTSPVPISTALSGTPGSPLSNSSSTGNSTSLQASRNCDAPVDTKYGLPTACLGDYFDEDLDDDLGHAHLSAESIRFVQEIAPQFIQESIPEDFKYDIDPEDTFWKQRRHLRGRSFWSFLDVIVKPLEAIYHATQQILSIGGSINKDISWQLPDSKSSNPDGKTLTDPKTKQVKSPWGDSILLKALGSQEEDPEKTVNGYMNIFCVGCGASGNAKIAGRARWTPLGGFLEGEVDIRTDIKFVLKIGIDAQITYKEEFYNDLINVGLPGLSYGVVTIGPRINVGSRVEVEAAAKGKLLAGAEMGLQDAHVLIDFVHSANSKKSGWEPYFKPVFEAEGELMLSTTLGLPIGIKCGLQIASWDKSVGIIDEPSIKGVAQVAASIGLSETGSFQGGFTETDGCTGISTQISWRNRLYIDILGLKEINLLDTDDRLLTRECIPLPSNFTKRHIGHRQTSEPTNPIVDITHKYKGGSSTLSYELESLPNSGYNDTDGYEYSLLVNPSGSTMIISCSNGNLYAVLTGGPDNELCSELWAHQNDALIYDGAQRLMHYYGTTMAKLGVSRLRVEPGLHGPTDSVVVAWAPYYGGPGPEEYYFVAVDPLGDVFYPAVCDYVDGQSSKLFLVRDPVEGIEILKSPDLMYTVTGGRVGDCFALVLMQGAHEAKSYLNLSNAPNGRG